MDATQILIQAFGLLAPKSKTKPILSDREVLANYEKIVTGRAG